ncbi:type I-E CRISPR-associated protein Cas6/Cse3/CasE [Nocardiopsis sp. NPDC049922]|uniref:type I-E CRISPR-associated protein Cas6/Cse3/CasE n=1 Tax=Nocardiopsis sp. NPDC049922 TaxID=3155157 RepID=UPI0033EAEF0B
MSLPEQLWLTHLPLTGHKRILGDPSAQHKFVMGLFPDGLGESPRQRAGALYRIEQNRDAAPSMLVQSLIAPNTAHHHGARVRSMLLVLDQMIEGNPVRYRLAVNPVRTVLPEGAEPKSGVRGRRKDLRGAEADQWWESRAKDAGLRLESLRSREHHFSRARKRTEKPVSYHGVCFDGVAEVVDRAALVRAVVEGIGRGRPYGLGLLSVVPIGG